MSNTYVSATAVLFYNLGFPFQEEYSYLKLLKYERTAIKAP
jgi:hypothetical protein